MKTLSPAATTTPACAVGACRLPRQHSPGRSVPYERFAELYLPTLEVLKADILPCVTDEILNEAAKVVVPPLPRLD